jgi:large subunit ribosomal protein L6
MSRIGQTPIDIPDGVNVVLGADNHVTVHGPRGELSRSFHPAMTFERTDGQIVVRRASDQKEHKALHGLTRTLLHNMVVGVAQGFEKRLELRGVGYRAEVQDRGLSIQAGFSHPVVYEPREGIEIEVDKAAARTEQGMPVTVVVVRGTDKEAVGQTAAEIRSIRRVEPYKGKGFRYVGEYVRRKAGKAGKVGMGG